MFYVLIIWMSIVPNKGKFVALAENGHAKPRKYQYPSHEDFIFFLLGSGFDTFLVWRDRFKLLRGRLTGMDHSAGDNKFKGFFNSDINLDHFFFRGEN